jgi:hypothetical protein
MVAASAIGLLYRAVRHPTDDLLQSFVPTDVFNLLTGLPILLGSMGLVRRGKLIGLLLWQGALRTGQLYRLCLCYTTQSGVLAASNPSDVERVHHPT